ncbi:exodeoxyribonuclease VII small subunit [Prochlorococcus marinus]|uniref:exodeoxyribonuclease VII small subunit n=1 Tax=Prochlorococcus marinus TaxID=1219 RepID=UPI0022B58166|nr:exodeoxyribonuclease VII small subunit [Prochlorococcus marinus]
MTFAEEESRSHLSMPKQSANKENIEILKKDINKLSYEECIAELESILLNVQDENISLDKIQINYIKGHLLLKHCEELLQFCEQEINEINPEFLNID